MLTKNFVNNVVRAQLSKVNDLMFELQRIRNTNIDEHKPMSDIIIGQYLHDIIVDFSQVLCKMDYHCECTETTTSAIFDEIYNNFIEWCGHTMSSLNELNDQLPGLYLSREDAKRFDPKSEPLYALIEFALDTSLNDSSRLIWPGCIDRTIEELSNSVLNFKQGTFLMKTE